MRTQEDFENWKSVIGFHYGDCIKNWITKENYSNHFTEDWELMMDLLSKVQKTNLVDIEIKMKGVVSISFNRKTLTYSSGTMINNCFEAASSFIRWYSSSKK